MLKAGTIVGGLYRLNHLIADGGMSEVYLAEQNYSPHEKNRSFAIKRLLPRLAKNPLFVELFKQEASLATILHHHNIVVCHDFIKEKDNYFMVMEYLMGKEVGIITKTIGARDLVDRIKIALAVGLGVARALSYVHNKTDSQGILLRIVHGDISPQNIMVTTEGVVKLYDFGAFNHGSLHEEVVRGNPRYMSPEQISCQKIDPRSDVYSLCLVMLEMIFKDLIGKDILQSLSFSSVLKDRFGPYSDVAAFFMQGLADKKEQRLLSSDDMHARLSELAHTVGLSDPEPYLKEQLKSLASLPNGRGVSQQNPHDERRKIAHFAIMSIIVFMVVGFSVTILSKFFEPKYQHSIPYWSSNDLDQDLIKATPISDTAKSLKSSTVKKNGALHIEVHPWAEVFVDGIYFGATPMKAISLPAGQYVVQLKNPNVSAVALKVVTIYADKKTDLIHSFLQKENRWR